MNQRRIDMSAKNRDRHGRWRSRTVAFRVSEDEFRSIDEAVALSGLTKQDYLISKLLDRDVVVYGNPRVFKVLKTKMDAIYEELHRLESAGEVTESLQETIDMVAKIYGGMAETPEKH